jgi:hypothetical protein
MNLGILVILLLLRAALDYYSAKHPSIWFDLVYIVVLVAFGVSCLESADFQSIAVGWASLVIAGSWFVYAGIRELRRTAKRDRG